MRQTRAGTQLLHRSDAATTHAQLFLVINVPDITVKLSISSLDLVHMGTAAELTAQKMNIGRAAQDAYARSSYERAQNATKSSMSAGTREW